MPNYHEYRNLFINASEEQKQAILRVESTRILTMAHGFALLIQMKLEEGGDSSMPDDYRGYSRHVVDGIVEMRALIHALTDRDEST